MGEERPHLLPLSKSGEAQVMDSPPLERDHWLTIGEPFERVMQWLASPERIASWFQTIKRQSTDRGVILEFPEGSILGIEQWHPDSPALGFRSYDRHFEGWMTIRSVILSGFPQVGTEIWIHLEWDRIDTDPHLIHRMDAEVRRGLSYMEKELCAT